MTDHIMVGQVIALRYVVSYQILCKCARSQQGLRLAFFFIFHLLQNSRYSYCSTCMPPNHSTTHTNTYTADIAITFNHNNSNNFLNSFYDDEGWWAITWIKAYDLTHRTNYLDMASSVRYARPVSLASIDCFVRSQHPQCAVGRPDSLSLLGACAVHLYFAQCLCDRQYSVSRRGQKSCGSSVVRHQTAIWRRLWANCGSCFSTCQKPAMMSYRLLSVGYQTACLTPDASV